MSSPFIYLASASPRRRALLEQIGVHPRLLGVDVDESPARGEAAPDYVVRLARAKAAAGLRLIAASGTGTGTVAGAGACAGGTTGAPVPLREPAPVLGADTAVLVDDEILGKPRDRADALRMLALLSGRRHVVLTAVALARAGGVAGHRIETRLSRSTVTFRAIAEHEAGAYWETGEPRDKAGAYAIQGRAAVFVADLSGSYSGVMGLPLYETAEMLEAAGIPCLPALP